MKKNVTIGGSLMKILSLTIMLAFIAPALINAQAGKANFAGTWTYNAEKSTQPAAGGGGGGGGQRGGMGGNFVATQDANLLTVTRTRTGQDGTPTTTVSKYTLDGKESVNTMGQGESKSVATWSADGKSLTIVTKTSFNGNERTSTQTWSITAPKTLAIVNSRTGQDGAEVKTTAVYEIK
jgi:hypothetical protein